MIYLSANGEVLGQFEESAVPSMVSGGKIPADAFYWREGMPEWRSVKELAPPVAPRPAPAPAVRPVRTPIPAIGAAGKKTIIPRRSVVPGAVATATLVKPEPELAEEEGTEVVAQKDLGQPVKPQAAAVAKAPVVARAPIPAIGAAGKKTVIPRRSLVPGAVATSTLVKPEQEPTEEEGTEAATQKDLVQPVTPLQAVAKPVPVGAKTFTPRRPAPAAARQAAPSAPMQPPDFATGNVPPAAATGRGKRWLVWLLMLLLLVCAAGGGAWWWLNRAPAAIPGRVVLGGDESGPAEIRVFGRDELAGAWRERLAAADARAAQLDKMLAEAEAVHRERKILYDEAAGVCAAGEEYNMPDVEELRADRDAKKAEADAARAELEKLQAEKGQLVSFEGLLQSVPAPRTTLVTDAEGNFLLPPPETGDVVLLATVSSGSEGGQVLRAWLEVLELAPDGAAPSAVQFAETNRLDVDEIRRFAAGE